MTDPNVFLGLVERCQLAARTHRMVAFVPVSGVVLQERCPNDPCPTCDRLPGGWQGWCARCGTPHAERIEVCNACERDLFWRELFW